MYIYVQLLPVRKSTVYGCSQDTSEAVCSEHEVCIVIVFADQIPLQQENQITYATDIMGWIIVFSQNKARFPPLELG